MKKNTTGILGENKGHITAQAKKTSKSKRRRAIGLDLGDKSSRYCIVEREANDVEVEVSKEGKLATAKKAIEQTFGALEPRLIALEVGTHSPWVSRLLSSLGHEVIIASARKVKAISENSKKNDRVDAQTLGRLALADRTLLHPIQHRGEQACSFIDGFRSRHGATRAAVGPGCSPFLRVMVMHSSSYRIRSRRCPMTSPQRNGSLTPPRAVSFAPERGGKVIEAAATASKVRATIE